MNDGKELRVESKFVESCPRERKVRDGNRVGLEQARREEQHGR